ncbi:MAG: peptidylprolyl isomerase [Bryobacterales bacterium]|nr:peptidylprolyl isomerase [Bryobacterales bacterium]
MRCCAPVAALILAAGLGRAADVRVIEQIVAKVNGEIVTSSELERSRRLLEAELRQKGLTGAELQTELEAHEKDLLRDRIDDLLIVQRAKELDLNVDSEVTKQLAEWQRQSKIADQDQFQEHVRQQSGMSYEDLRQEMRNQFMKQRLIRQEISSRVNVPKADIEKYYKEHQNEFVREDRVFLSEILVSTVGKSDSEIPALEKKAKELVDRARRGERFTELARENSGADSAEDEGRLGFFPRNQLQQQIADLVFNQERGYVTDPIRVPNGFLILRVDEKHTAGLASLEEVENEITQKLADPLVQPAIRDFLTKLRADAFLEIREGYEDSAPAPGKDTTWMVHAQLKPETVTKEEVVSRRYRPRLLWVIPMWYERTAGGD